MPADASTDGAQLQVTIREAGLDSWSDIRFLHAQAFRARNGGSLDSGQIDAFVDWIYSPDYTDALMTHDLQTAWIDGHLVGTAGWVPADDTGSSARITCVYISPLFGRMGLGRRMVAAAEQKARAAGFSAFSARIFPASLTFFEALGYARSSQGLLALGTQNGLPVTFVRKPGSSVRTSGESDCTGAVQA